MLCFSLFFIIPASLISMLAQFFGEAINGIKGIINSMVTFIIIILEPIA
jgi:hypothetical protein